VSLGCGSRAPRMPHHAGRSRRLRAEISTRRPIIRPRCASAPVGAGRMRQPHGRRDRDGGRPRDLPKLAKSRRGPGCVRINGIKMAGVPARDRLGFAFMTNESRPNGASRSAGAHRPMMRAAKEAGERIASSAAVVVHTGGGAYFCELSVMGTWTPARGQRARRARRGAGSVRHVARRGHGERRAIEGGHRHHMRAINASTAPAVCVRRSPAACCARA